MDTLLELDPMAPIAPRPEPNVFRIVHPLDDEPEAKCDPDALGAMHMGRTSRLSLLALRFYLIAMIALVGYRVVEAAGTMHF